MISWTGSNKPLGKIGLVGCGRMGKCMLESMKNNGYEVVAYDKFPAAVEAAKTMGAEVKRILARNGKQAAEIFACKWIPLEEAYFNAYKIKERCEIQAFFPC